MMQHEVDAPAQEITAAERYVAHWAERKTLTVEEAARELGLGRSAAYEAARTGELPTIRIGKRLLVPRQALDRLLSGQQASADQPRTAA